MKIPTHDEIARMDADAAKLQLEQFAKVAASLVDQNHRQSRVISELFKKIAVGDQSAMFSKDALAKLQNMLFGDRSEKLPPLTGTLGDAVQYALNEWAGLTVFLTHPGVGLDNNLAERNLRGPVVGRKNHYGSRSRRGAEVTSTFYTIIETCKMCGVDPRRFLTDAVYSILKKDPVKMPWDYKTQVATHLADATPAA
ncbi:MAG: transposase [Deltaproteobacteria bacterium]|nr:transposase [Deltaproteobacteria bacterium]